MFGTVPGGGNLGTGTFFPPKNRSGSGPGERGIPCKDVKMTSSTGGGGALHYTIVTILDRIHVLGVDYVITTP